MVCACVVVCFWGGKISGYDHAEVVLDAIGLT
jgi:hypothetical protein